MKAFILAAGLGTRLRPLTDDRPKALVEVAGKPLIDHAVETILRAGITEVVINVHHFADKLIDHIHSWQYPGLTVHISDERHCLMDTGGAIWQARPLLSDDEPFLVFNVDIISDIDITSMAREHKRSGALATLAVRERETSRSLMVTSDGWLCGWINHVTGEEKLCFDAPHSLLAFSGIHIISQDIWKFAPADAAPASIIDIYLELARQGEHIGTHPHDVDLWLDLGRAEQIRDAEDELERSTAKRRRGGRDWTKAFILAAAFLLLPFLLLSFFAVPAADDFYFSAQASLLGLTDYVSHFFGRYTGRLLPTLLFYVNPMSFGATKLYYIPLLLNMMFFGWTVFLLIPVFSGPIRPCRRVAVTFALLLVFLQFFPSPAQGFYWLSGVLFYTLPLSLLMLLAKALHARFEAGRRCGRALASAVILAFLLPLCNETVAIPAGLLVALIAFSRLRKHEDIRAILLVAAGLVAGITIQLLAPGNYARMGDFGGMDDGVPSMLRAIDPVAKLIGLMLLNPLLWLGSLLMLAGSWQRSGKWQDTASRIPLWIIIPSGFILLLLMYLPSEHIAGYIPWRVHNTGSLVFLALWYILLLRADRLLRLPALPSWATKALVAMALITLLGDLHLDRDRKAPVFRGNIPEAWFELLTMAGPYASWWQDVYELSRNIPGDTLVLREAEIPPPPPLIHFTGLTPMENHDLNRWYSLYFGLEAVRIDQSPVE